MARFFRSRLYAALWAVLIVACGSGDVPRTAPPGALSAPDAPGAVPPAEPVSVSLLAVALEGDVEQKSETEYEAKGPEIRCVAVLIEGETPAMVTSEVRWEVEPGSAGVFSAGAQGVFFLPDAKGTATIRAAYPAEGDVVARSPGLLLHCP